VRSLLAGFSGFVAGFFLMLLLKADVRLAASTAVLAASVFLCAAAVLNRIDALEEKLSRK